MGLKIALALICSVALLGVLLGACCVGDTSCFGATGGMLLCSITGFVVGSGGEVFSRLGCGMATGGADFGLLCFAGAGRAVCEGSGSSINWASTAAGSDSRSLESPIKTVNDQMMATQIAIAAGKVQYRRRQGVSYSQSLNGNALVDMFNGDQKVLRTRLARFQHCLNGDAVGCGVVGGNDHVCLGSVQHGF